MNTLRTMLVTLPKMEIFGQVSELSNFHQDNIFLKVWIEEVTPSKAHQF